MENLITNISVEFKFLFSLVNYWVNPASHLSVREGTIFSKESKNCQKMEAQFQRSDN